MKRTIVAVILLLAFAMPVAAQDYTFEITSVKGKYYEDGFFSSSISDSGLCFDIYIGDWFGDTSYYFDGEFWDCYSDSFFVAHGIIIFNNSETKAAFQGTCSDGDFTWGFIDGTITCSGSRCKIAAKAGFNGTPDFDPYLYSLTAFSGFLY